MQSQWQENYVITAGPTGTTTTGGASGSGQASGDASWYEGGSDFAESDSSGSGYSYASGNSLASDVSGQDHYHDQSSWSEPYNLVGASSSGTTVDNVWGNATTAWNDGTWSSSQGPSSGSGSGSGSSTSSATSGSFSTSYDQVVGYSGFLPNADFYGMGASGDPGWRWGVGWAGAGPNGPLGPSAYSGLGYTFAPGVTVAPVNDQFDAEGQAVSVPVQASGSGVVYSAQGLPAGVAINASTGLISGTIAAGAYAAGPLYVTTVTATDAAGASASQSFVWLISDPVTLTNPGDQSSTEGVGVDLIPTATDVNPGDLFTWTETGLPAGLSLDPDGGAISGTPAAGSAGVYVVTLTATDLGGASASQAFVWTVAPAVTIPDPGVQSDTEGDTVSLQLTATDAAGTLSFTETLDPDLLNKVAARLGIAPDKLATLDYPWNDVFGMKELPNTSGVITYAVVAYYFPNLPRKKLEEVYGFKLAPLKRPADFSPNRPKATKASSRTCSARISGGLDGPRGEVGLGLEGRPVPVRARPATGAILHVRVSARSKA